MPLRTNRRGPGTPLQVCSGHGVFTGYASLFGRRDGAGDIMMPGAFAASLKKRGPKNIRMLFQHDPGEPVGKWSEIRETGRGLYVRGVLNTRVQRGRELLALLEEGGLDGLSIGFRTIRARNERSIGARLLLEVDLWEISLVTFPMLEGARIETLKKIFPNQTVKGELSTWI
jgi:hypothetical protein